MAKTKRNKALARTIVGLGTLWAGAVIWASISGQTQAVTAAIEDTTLTDPILESSALVKLDNPIDTQTVTPVVIVTPGPSAALTTPAVAPPATSVAATTTTTPAQTAVKPVQTTTTVTPSPTTVTPKITVTPTVTAKPVVTPTVKVKTRGS
jgi:hypothetical protein